MYRRPKFLEVLLDIRSEMAREADYDVDLFVETARSEAISDDSDRGVASALVSDVIETDTVLQHKGEARNS